MPNSGRNTTAALVRPKLLTAVYVSADASTDPTEDDERPGYVFRRIQRGAGGRDVTCEIEVSVSRYGRIQDERLKADANRRVQVWTLKAAKSRSGTDVARDKCLFRGEIVATGLSLRPETRLLIARVPDYHFGSVIDGQEVWNYRTSDTETIPIDLEFQPVIDGKICDNMVPAAGEEESGTNTNPNDYAIWVDPESSRTTTAQDEYHSTPVPWTLRKILHTLSEIANPSETFIAGLSATYLSTVLPDNETPAIRNLILPRGSRLREYLSAVLHPYGYNWFPEFLDSLNSIGVFKRGSGTERTVRLDRFGSTIDRDKNNVDSPDITYDVGTLSNKLIVHGARREVEVTLPLYRGWQGDEISQHDVDDPAGRLWVANEGGDYTDMRPEITAPPDIFGNNTVPRRRVMEDCLTYWPGTSIRRPVFVEVSLDGGSTWFPMDGDENHQEAYQGTYTLLPDQIGIYISEQAIPDDLQDVTSNLKLRITGTVRDDKRLNYTTDAAEGSPNSGELTRLIDASDQFFYRQRKTGTFASLLTGTAATADDQTALESYADKLLETEKAAQVTARLRLPGLVFDYEIGDVLTEIEGRAISLNRHSDSSGTTEYLQVVGINYDNTGDQYTELVTEQFDR